MSSLIWMKYLIIRDYTFLQKNNKIDYNTSYVFYYYSCQSNRIIYEKMNLFILSLLPREIAEFMMDKHISKIIVEAVQLAESSELSLKN